MSLRLTRVQKLTGVEARSPLSAAAYMVQVAGVPRIVRYWLGEKNGSAVWL